MLRELRGLHPHSLLRRDLTWCVFTIFTHPLQTWHDVRIKEPRNWRKVRIRNVRSCYIRIRAMHVQRNSRSTTKLQRSHSEQLWWVRSVMFEYSVRVHFIASLKYYAQHCITTHSRITKYLTRTPTLEHRYDSL